MITQRELILGYLRTHPDGADDDELAARLDIPQRQTVNRICRELARDGIVERKPSATTGKLVNRLIRSPR
jgi:DNA-binding IclR family transcriptional regulator